MGEGNAFNRGPLFVRDTVRQRVILCLGVLVVPMEAQVHLTEFSLIIAEIGILLYVVQHCIFPVLIHTEISFLYIHCSHRVSFFFC